MFTFASHENLQTDSQIRKKIVTITQLEMRNFDFWT